MHYIKRNKMYSVERGNMGRYAQNWGVCSGEVGFTSRTYTCIVLGVGGATWAGMLNH